MSTYNFIQLYDQNGNEVYPVVNLNGFDVESKTKRDQLDASIAELYNLIAELKKQK